MTQKNNNKTLHIFESVLFVFLMCVIALRLSFMENPSIESFSLPGVFYDNLVSVIISSLLIISGAVWFAVRLSGGKYRMSGIEYGVLIFIIAAVLSTIAASNRRTAITDSITILSAMVTAVVLSNLLETIERKKVLLFVLTGMAIANVYQCTEQSFSSNKLMIEEYKAEPVVQLQKLGIEPGSFEQMLYENRLYSKDVRGFFTTGNSVGSLLVLAIFCTFAAFDFKVKLSEKKNALKKLWLPTVLLLVLFAGLLEAHSKGAIASLAAAGGLLFLSVRFGQILRRHQGLIIISAVILIILCTAFIVSYGAGHNKLPGGNSMLVRWQYWAAAVKIAAGHLITGIGGGNFSSYYTHYKIPQALETIKDPHCFILSILSQYGIIGMAGFCMAIFYPIIMCSIQNKASGRLAENSLTALAKVSGISIVLVLLFVRPIAIRAEIGNSIDVILYVIAIMYAAPAFFAGTTLWLCTRTEEQSKTRQIFVAAILCGLLAVLIHNLIDFALFEPGIMTAFWACVALVSSDYRPKNITDSDLKPNRTSPIRVKESKIPDGHQRRPDSNGTRKNILAASAVLTAAALIWFCIIPGVKTAVKTETARLLFANGEIEEGTTLLLDASADDILNPTPAAFAGKMLLYAFEMNPGNSPEILLAAEKSLLTAIQRDKADYKNYENLAKVYETLAQITPNRRSFWFEKAFSALQNAMERYPASSELHTEFAETCELLGNINLAIEHYKKAVEIEDAYTEQFKIMYPGKEIFSRMGKVKYIQAREKIENLRR